MAKRVVEVFYELRDLFTGKIRKITSGYDDLSASSSRTADRIERNNKRASASFASLSAAIGKARTLWFSLTGIVSSGLAVRSLQNFAREAENIGRVSERLGVATEELSALQFAAERSNISLQTLSVGLQRLTRRSAEAAQGTGEAKDALKELGIDAQAFINLSLNEKIDSLADAFASVGNQSDRVRLAFKLFDTEGVTFLDFLQQGSAALRATRKEAEQFGAVLSSDIAQAAKEFNDNLRLARENLQGFGFSAGGRALEGFNLLAETFGIAANEMKNLERAVERAQAQFDAKAGLISAQSLEYQTLARNLAAAQAELRAYALQLGKAAVAEQNAAEARAQQQRTNDEYLGGLRDLTANYQTLSDQRIAAINREVSELESAQQQQSRIVDEFNKRFDDITTNALKPEDVSLGDVFLAQRQAAAAADQGEADKAVELARKGFDLLELLKKKGTETSGTLQFLARQLKTVAEEASAKDVAKEQTQVDAAKLAFAEVQKQADFLKTQAPEAGSQYAKSFIKGMQQEFAAAQVTPPAVQQASEPTIRRNGNSFSDGTDFREALEREGAK